MAKSDKKQKKAKQGKDNMKGKKNSKGKEGDPERAAKKGSRASERVAASTAKLKLADRKCVPCRGGTPPMTASEIGKLLPKLKGWSALNNHHLERDFKFADFAAALDFTIEVGELAEVEQHHPDIHLSWGKVRIEIWTHKIDGLTESDFVLAAKIDQLA